MISFNFNEEASLVLNRQPRKPEKMPMTVVAGRFSTAFLPAGSSISRLLSVKYAAQRRVIFVSRSARASSLSVSVETNSNVRFFVLLQLFEGTELELDFCLVLNVFFLGYFSVYFFYSETYVQLGDLVLFDDLDFSDDSI